MKMLPHKKIAKGMTLLELTVVLAILAVVTSIAVSSFSAVEDQSRFDGTVRQVENIEAAILGQPDLRTADNQQLINGFLADMGRMPTATIIGGNPPQPIELWAKQVSTETYSLRPAIEANITAAFELTPAMPVAPTLQTMTPIVAIANVSDGSVFVGSGWRGPYLRLPVGSESLRDSWGNLFDFFKFDGSPVTADGDTIFSLRSRGADFPTLGVTDGYAREIELSTTVPTDRFRGSVTVQVKTAGAAAIGEIAVHMFTPDGANGRIACYQIKNSEAILANGTYTVVFPKEALLAGGNKTVTTIGSRVFKAYRGTAPIIPSATTIRSAPIVVTIPHNGLSNAIQLELP